MTPWIMSLHKKNKKKLNEVTELTLVGIYEKKYLEEFSSDGA